MRIAHYSEGKVTNIAKNSRLVIMQVIHPLRASSRLIDVPMSAYEAVVLGKQLIKAGHKSAGDKFKSMEVSE